MRCLRSTASMIAAILSISTAQAATPSAKRCKAEVIPAIGIGEIEVGASVAALHERGVVLAVDARFSAMKRYKDLLILLSPDGERIQTVELNRENFGRCVRVGDVALTKIMTLEQMAASLGRCGPLDMRIGGTLVQCGDGLGLRQTLAGIGITVESADVSSSPKLICQTYVASSDERFSVYRGTKERLVRRKKGAVLPVGGDAGGEGPICYGGRIFTSAVSKEQFKHQFCTKVDHASGAQLNCGNIGYRFDGHGALRELLLFPYAL